MLILASLTASYTTIVQTLGSQAEKHDLSHVMRTVMDEDAREKVATVVMITLSSAMTDKEAEIQPNVCNATPV